MGYKYKFTTPIDSILKNHSGWSGVKCETCKRETTNAQLAYSMKFYGKPLCRTCQSLENYGRPFYAIKKGGGGNGDSGELG